MKAAQKLGLMASIIGMTSAIFGGRKQAQKEQEKIGRERVRLTGRNQHVQGGGMPWNPQAIFIPRRTAFKGWRRDNKNWGRRG